MEVEGAGEEGGEKSGQCAALAGQRKAVPDLRTVTEN